MTKELPLEMIGNCSFQPLKSNSLWSKLKSLQSRHSFESYGDLAIQKQISKHTIKQKA